MKLQEMADKEIRKTLGTLVRFSGSDKRVLVPYLTLVDLFGEDLDLNTRKALVRCMIRRSGISTKTTSALTSSARFGEGGRKKTRICIRPIVMLLLLEMSLTYAK